MRVVVVLFRITSIVLCLLSFSVANADLVIDVGDIELAPKQPDQKIELFVSGDQLVQGLNFNIQIDGMGQLPSVTDVDLVGGTIFAANHRPPTQIADFPQLQVWTIATSSGAVLADGLLATVTLDTTGVSNGIFELNLLDTINGPTDFADPSLVVTISDGTLSVVPEPSSATFFCILTACVFFIRAFAEARRDLGLGFRCTI